MMPVPAEPEPITVGGGGRLKRADTLLDQRMSRRGDVMLKRDRFTAIRNPATHELLRQAPFETLDITPWLDVSPRHHPLYAAEMVANVTFQTSCRKKCSLPARNQIKACQNKVLA